MQTENIRIDNVSASRSADIPPSKGSLLITTDGKLQWNSFSVADASKQFEFSMKNKLKLSKGKKDGQLLMYLKWKDDNGRSSFILLFFGAETSETAVYNFERVKKLFAQAVAPPASITNRNTRIPNVSVNTNQAAYRPPPAPLVRQNSTDRGIPGEEEVIPSIEEQKLRARMLVQKDFGELHKNLVVDSGVVTETQFWEGRDDVISEERAKVEAQKTGLQASHKMGSQSRVMTGDTIEFKVTKEMMERVFFECPMVHQRYKQYVPDKLSNEEFWTMYFHSKYFHREGGIVNHGTVKEGSSNMDKSRIEAKAEQIFGYEGDDNDEALESREKEEAKRSLQRVDPEVNLVNTYNDLPVQTGAFAPNDAIVTGSFGVADRDPAAERTESNLRTALRRKRARGVRLSADQINQLIAEPPKSTPIVYKYNKHGTRILENEQGYGHGTLTARDYVRNHDLLEEDLERYERQRQHNKRLAKFNVANKAVFAGMGDVSATGNTTSQNGYMDPAVKARCLGIASGLKEYKHNAERALPSSATSGLVLDDLEAFSTATAAQNSKLMGNTVRKLQDVNADVRKYIIRCFNAANELCRHFWAANKRKDGLPKMRRVNKRIVELHNELEKERREFLKTGIKAYSANAMLLLPIMEQLRCATIALEKREKKAAMLVKKRVASPVAQGAARPAKRIK